MRFLTRRLEGSDARIFPKRQLKKSMKEIYSKNLDKPLLDLKNKDLGLCEFDFIF